ncbi:hypothetical protein IFM61606_04401 [Aspergillus udagawae]|nr:hypothetical protein IFM51744_05312 [Aspergillus udagawae]GFG13551.1 hypothetical protein IFM5058_06508 [Aspergillus udagawae]GFG24490.1 hypothetical protein IFM61606_04401 [Aspergillus udagawae]
MIKPVGQSLPTVVMESGWSESRNGLRDDMNLWLVALIIFLRCPTGLITGMLIEWALKGPTVVACRRQWCRQGSPHTDMAQVGTNAVRGVAKSREYRSAEQAHLFKIMENAEYYTLDRSAISTLRPDLTMETLKPKPDIPTGQLVAQMRKFEMRYGFSVHLRGDYCFAGFCILAEQVNDYTEDSDFLETEAR